MIHKIMHKYKYQKAHSLLLFSIFIAEGQRLRNDAPVLSNSSCLLLLSCTPPESCQSSLLYHLIILLAFLCLLHHQEDLQKMYMQRFCAVFICPKYCCFCFLTADTSCLSVPISFSEDSLVLWSSSWYAAQVSSMSSQRLSACQCRLLWEFMIHRQLLP